MLLSFATELPSDTTISPVAVYPCSQRRLSDCDSYWTVAVGAKNAVSMSPCAVIRSSFRLCAYICNVVSARS